MVIVKGTNVTESLAIAFRHMGGVSSMISPVSNALAKKIASGRITGKDIDLFAQQLNLAPGIVAREIRTTVGRIPGASLKEIWKQGDVPEGSTSYAELRVEGLEGVASKSVKAAAKKVAAKSKPSSKNVPSPVTAKAAKSKPSPEEVPSPATAKAAKPKPSPKEVPSPATAKAAKPKPSPKEVPSSVTAKAAKAVVRKAKSMKSAAERGHEELMKAVDNLRPKATPKPKAPMISKTPPSATNLPPVDIEPPIPVDESKRLLSAREIALRRAQTPPPAPPGAPLRSAVELAMERTGGPIPLPPGGLKHVIPGMERELAGATETALGGGAATATGAALQKTAAEIQQLEKTLKWIPRKTANTLRELVRAMGYTGAVSYNSKEFMTWLGLPHTPGNPPPPDTVMEAILNKATQMGSVEKLKEATGKVKKKVETQIAIAEEKLRGKKWKEIAKEVALGQEEAQPRAAGGATTGAAGGATTGAEGTTTGAIEGGVKPWKFKISKLTAAVTALGVFGYMVASTLLQKKKEMAAMEAQFRQAELMLRAPVPSAEATQYRTLLQLYGLPGPPVGGAPAEGQFPSPAMAGAGLTPYEFPIGG